MKKFLLTLAFGGLMVTSASAATLTCASTTNVVTSLGVGTGNNCNVAGSSLLFSDFTVTPSSGFLTATVGIGTATSAAGETYLTFQLGNITGPTAPSAGDIILTYRVAGAISGVDFSITGTSLGQGGTIVFTEQVCTAAYNGSTCSGTTLGQIAGVTPNPNGPTAEGTLNFAQQSSVYIKKDIQFNNAVVTDFTNSHASNAVPEPGSMALLGSGLLGLGLIARRRAQK